MKKNRIWQLLFAAYGIVMLWLLFDRVGYESGIPYRDQLKFNLMPFHTIRLFWDALRLHTYRTSAIINLLGNILMFIPLGFLLPLSFPRLGRLWKTLLTAVGIVVTVEVLQMLTLLGTCDIDDLILNTVGTIMGYTIHILLHKTSLPK